MAIDEGKFLQKIEKKAEFYIEKYEPYMDEAVKMVEKCRTFTNNDAYNLGKQLQQWEDVARYQGFNESASDLGVIPSIAMDFITANYATSVAPLLASMQTIEAEQGFINFKNVTTTNTRADRTAGDTFFTSKNGIVNGLDNYASEKIENEVLGSTTNAVTHYDLTAAATPIRSNINITITCPGVTGATGVFINGVLMSSAGVWTGDINYTNGDINIDFAANPGAGHDIFMTYHQDLEKSSDVPAIGSTLISTNVLAEIVIIKQLIETMKAFSMQKRLGKVAENEVLIDLIGAANDIESRKVINGYIDMANWVEANYAGKVIEFSVATPTGISEFEHRQSFRYRLAELDSAINSNSGRGAANRYIAGYNMCEYISSLPKFTAAAVNVPVGPHVYGYYDGKPVIRTSYVNTDECIGGYLNPQSPFEAPFVIGTYMPMFITNTMQMGNNPLVNQRAVASWKAYKSVVGEFVKKIRLIP